MPPDTLIPLGDDYLLGSLRRSVQGALFSRIGPDHVHAALRQVPIATAKIANR